MYTFDNDTSVLSKWIRDEVDFPGNIGKGKRNTAARRIQEWLCLHGHHIVVDSDFGNVTEDAVQAFQKSKGFSQSGVVDQKTHEALVKPMLTVLSHKPKKSLGFGAMVTNYAKAHLKQHPREVGGANRGPWVRMYMKGNEGKPWAWCAGFTTFLMEQTAETKDVAMPIKGSFSCDTLAAQAKNAGLFMRERDVSPDKIPSGSLFLVRRTSTDWTHVGVVTEARAGVFETIEGNTNDDGDREGYEVCARRRGYSKRNFIILK